MTRRQDIEWLRVFSAFGIVVFHSAQAGALVAYSGLVVFLILSPFLALGSHNPESQTVRGRAVRLLVPWLFWLAVYGAVNLLAGRPILVHANGPVAGLLMGSSYHLWYLPFMFFALVGIDMLNRRFNRTVMALAAGAASAFLLLISPAWRPWSLSVGEPLAQYAHALPGVLFGVFLACALKWPGWVRLMVLVACLVGAAAAWSLPGVGLPYVLAVLVTSAILLSHDRLPRGFDVSLISNATFGVYLVHPLAFQFLHRLPMVHGWWLPCAGFALSLFLVMAARRLMPVWSAKVM